MCSFLVAAIDTVNWLLVFCGVAIIERITLGESDVD